LGGGALSMTNLAALEAFFSANPKAIACELTSVRGSSPREQGTFMLVGQEAIFGTIGGGALEYMVIYHARKLIAEGRAEAAMDVPLGPEIGQCCGGRVGVSLHFADAMTRAKLAERIADDDAKASHVYIFGAGHVGRVLAQILALLPVKVEVIDTRREELALLAPEIAHRLVAMPEFVVRSAPPGSAFVIVTHDHALDFLIANEALARQDAAYVGMVGSKTKRAKFSSWFIEQGGDAAQLERVILPIGAQGIGDKRPSVIAALAAAEVMVHIGEREASVRSLRTPSEMGVASGF
jgi:xanthine dehydrogenase accessory factor